MSDRSIWTTEIHGGAGALLLVLLAGCASGEKGEEVETGLDDDTAVEDLSSRILALSPLPAPPEDPTNAVADDPDAAWFGRWLYFDTRLSGSGEHSCATCHDPALGFGDGLDYSVAAGTTGRHAPTVLNSVYNDWFFWDGRADSHWMQALGPIEDDAEQAFTRLEVVHLVVEDADLTAAYEATFGPLPDLSDQDRFPPVGRPVPNSPTDERQVAWDSMTEEDQETVNVVFVNLGKAIAAYERLLVRGDAPFDTYVEGLRSGDADKLGAISEEAVAGLDLYLTDGNCHFCHSGPTFTNNEFHNIGMATHTGQRPDDLGRYEGIQVVLESEFNSKGPYSDDPDFGALKLDYLAIGDEQLGQFKVPTLRNVATHPPYMVAGQLATLTEVVEFYNQLPEEPMFGHREDLMVELGWGEAEVASMVAFLESLTGEPLPAELTTAPDSPVPPSAR